MRRELFDHNNSQTGSVYGTTVSYGGCGLPLLLCLNYLLYVCMSHEEIQKAYPELEEKDIPQAIGYAAWLAGEYQSGLCPQPNRKTVRYKMLIFTQRRKERVELNGLSMAYKIMCLCFSLRSLRLCARQS